MYQTVIIYMKQGSLGLLDDIPEAMTVIWVRKKYGFDRNKEKKKS